MEEEEEAEEALGRGFEEFICGFEEFICGFEEFTCGFEEFECGFEEFICGFEAPGRGLEAEWSEARRRTGETEWRGWGATTRAGGW